jgi:DNA-binding GntR family transcriptional regulator
MSDVSMRISSVAAPVRSQVAATLRSAILAGRFKPGERLVERELCELTGVSRPSVREALRELEAEGLISNVPNRGPVVARVTREDVAHIYEIRGVLEGLAAQLFAKRASNAQLRQLERAVDAFERASSSGDVDRLIETKGEIYRILFEGAGNTVLPQLVRTMTARVNFLRRVSLASRERLPASVEEIRAILEALRRRDPDAAFAASLRHVENACAAALTVIDV